MKIQPTSRVMKVCSVLSTVVLAVLLLGYFGTFGVLIARTPPVGSTAVRTTSIELDAGRVCIWTETDSTPRPTASSAPHSIWWESWRPRFPDIKRAVWEFDNHKLAGSKAFIQADIFAFPIWCIGAPFLIAPTIYLRRRLMNRREPAGFTVVGIAGGDASL